MVWIITLSILILAVLAFLFLARKGQGGGTATPLSPLRQASPAKLPGQAPAPAPSYWGKQLNAAGTAASCHAAKVLHGQCFAFHQAPSLPLKECNSAACECRYEPLVDRRSGNERRSGTDRRGDIRFETQSDRRSGKDRRQTDHYHWHYTA